MKARPFLQGAGLATILILPVSSIWLGNDRLEAYHQADRVSGISLSILLAALLLCLLAWLLFAALERAPGWWKDIGWIALSVLPIAVLAVPFAQLLPQSISFRVLNLLRDLRNILPFILLLSLFFWRHLYTKWIAVTRWLYLIAAFGLLVIVPRLAFSAFYPQQQKPTSFYRADLPAADPSQPRIVWLLFDELSYNQVFDHRQQDVLLPHLDAFRKQSISFSSLRPIDYYTEHVIPGLFAGEPIHDLQTPYNGPLRVRDVSDGSWHTYDENATIFADARSLGWTTGVSGFYNPYCWLLRDVLDACSWQPYSLPAISEPARLVSYHNSVARNMLAILPFHRILDHFRRDSRYESELYAMQCANYRTVMKGADDQLQDQRIRFVFVHIPVPHPPAIYNRKTHMIAPHGTYLDSLVLADDTLDGFMKKLRQLPDYQSTTVIVSSDHSWRTGLWRGSNLWKPEEERASNGGHFDDRPVLMIHLPGQNAGQNIAKPVNVLIAHTILEELLRGQIHNPAEVNTLVEGLSPQSIVWQSGKAAEDAQSGN